MLAEKLFYINKENKVTGVFKGLNHEVTISDGEFSDEMNLSDRNFPVLSTRKKRGVSLKFTTGKGIIYDIRKVEGHFYILSSNGFHKDDTLVYSRSNLGEDPDKCRLVSMGARIVIWPDKVVYDVLLGTYKDLEAKFLQAGTVSYHRETNPEYTKIEYAGLGNVFSVGDAVTISGSDEASLNGTHIVAESGTDYITIIAEIPADSTQASGLHIDREVPDFDFVCEHGNRLFGCMKNEIYASKLGDPSNFFVFEGTTMDSYAASVGTQGDFTGCFEYGNSVLFFKTDAIHVLYGDRPANFTINTVKTTGVYHGASHTVAISDGILYYYGIGGVYGYASGTATLISKMLNIVPKGEALYGAFAENKYYFLDPGDSIYVYGTRYGIWHKETEDGGPAEVMFSSDSRVYFADTDGIFSVEFGHDDTEERNEKLIWFAESGDIAESLIGEKYITNLTFNLRLEKGSEVTIFVKYDDDPMFTRMWSFFATKPTSYQIPLIPHRCNQYRYRIEGKGEAKILGISRAVEGGSDINGNPQTRHN